MKILPRPWMASAIAIMSAFGFSSCAYDPYYSSVGGSYSSGYGSGYGYGGSNFSTSLFVSTGDPRWGYDPYCHSYYDYRSRRYYDPYLYGYYPVGYRPVVVVGAPHPHGWRPGRGYCPPPVKVRNVTVQNYRNREAAYRNSNYSWAGKVRAQPSPQTRGRNPGSNHNIYGSPTSSGRNTPYGDHPSSIRSSSAQRLPSKPQSSPNRGRNAQQQGGSPEYRQRNGSGLPSAYNTPVARPASPQADARKRNSGTRAEARQPATNRQPARPANQRGDDRDSREPSTRESRKNQPIRSLGQG